MLATTQNNVENGFVIQPVTMCSIDIPRSTSHIVSLPLICLVYRTDATCPTLVREARTSISITTTNTPSVTGVFLCTAVEVSAPGTNLAAVT